MTNSNFSGFLCPPACDSQNESLYNVDKNLNGTFELHSILKFEKSTIFDGLDVQILKSTFLKYLLSSQQSRIKEILFCIIIKKTF